MRIQIKNKALIAVTTAACIISLLFSTLSIMTAVKMADNITTQKEHPFAVTEATYKLRNINNIAILRLNRLVMYNTQADTEIVREALEDIQTYVGQNFEIVKTQYLGPAEDSAHIEMSYDELVQKIDPFLNDADLMTHEEVRQHIDTELVPIFEELDIHTQKVLDFARATTEHLASESSWLLVQTIVFSVVFMVFMVILSVLLYREYTEKLRERSIREFLFEFLADNIDDVFMVYNMDRSQMEYVFSNVEKVLGIASDRVMEEPSAFFDYWADPEDAKSVKQLLETHGLFEKLEKEIRYRNPKTQQERWMNFAFQSAIGKDGEERYIVSAFDLTRIKRNQQALKDALVSAQNASRAKTDFLSRMSHEIRTPMNAIIGMTTIAATAIDNPPRLEDCLTKIATSSRHLLMIINDILDLSKIESGKMSIYNEPFNFGELLKNVTSIVYPQTRDKALGFDIVMQNVVSEMLVGDSLRLNQVLLNILSNSIKYTPTGGSVKITVQQIPQKRNATTLMRFIIADTGIGMSEEFLKRIFDPFEQEMRAANARNGSTGIGMAITKNIVSLMNGSISVESQQDKGTTVIVDIPFEIQEGIRYQTAELNELKVLVADDDKDTCEHVALLLGKMHIEAEWVLLAEEAVQKIIEAYEQGPSYDVLFLDWKMTDIDGVEATRKIRRVVGPDVLIIIISAYDWSEIEQEARLAGVDAFIPKPMMASSIYNTLVANVLRASRPITLEDIKDIHNDFTGKRFLVAEDNELNMEIAVTLLETMGAEVEGALDGVEMVDKFMASEPGYYDLILADIQMPRMDGHEATHEIRKSEHPQAATIPIIAMTANAFAEDVIFALDAGMNAHIAKPIDIQLLGKTIDKYLRQE